MALLLSLETKLGSIPLILCEIMGTVQFPETILDKEQGLWWSAVTPNVTGLTNCFKSTFLFTRSARDARWGRIPQKSQSAQGSVGLSTSLYLSKQQPASVKP